MKNNRIESLADIKELEAQGMSKSNALFHKLSLCAKKAILDEERQGCHLIDIYRHLGRCIDSNYTYYDKLMDVWSEYFLKEDRT